MLTKSQWGIALAGVAIVVATQFLQLLHGTELREVVLSEDGHVFASSSFRKPLATPLYHWQPGLSARERIVDTEQPVHSIACTSNGELLLYVNGAKLKVFDLENGTIRWTVGQEKAEVRNADIFPFMSDQFTLIIENAILNDTSAMRRPIMHVIRNADGFYVGAIEDAMFAKVLSEGNTLKYQDRFSVKKAIQIHETAEGTPELVPAESSASKSNRAEVTVWNGTRRKPMRHNSLRGDLEVSYTNTASSVPTRLTLRNRTEGTQLGNQWVSLHVNHKRLLSLISAGLLMAWCCIFNLNARSDFSDRRFWTDAAILSCVVLLMASNLHWLFGMSSQAAHPNSKTATVLIGIAFTMLFVLPLATNRPMHRWGMFLVACAFPFLAPIFGLAALLRFCGFHFVLHPKAISRITMVPEVFHRDATPAEIPDRAPIGIRFGIQELMWVTAGIAIFISVGWMSLVLIPLGAFFAVALGVAAWMCHHPASANAVSAVALAILSLLPEREVRLYDPLPITLLLVSICLLFGILGARWRHLSQRERRPKSNTGLGSDRRGVPVTMHDG